MLSAKDLHHWRNESIGSFLPFKPLLWELLAREEDMEYRCVTTSLSGFVQQLACNVLPHGYWFYVMGIVPDAKSPESVDAKLLDKYGIAISRQQRARRKLAGTANLHYLRLGRVWILLATHEFNSRTQASAWRSLKLKKIATTHELRLLVQTVTQHTPPWQRM